MFLKSLTLKGFKSFADRSQMVFEPGLTVIVGPNGSGKSNVSDAILWVLGEQSAKQLRGAAMEDVVFAGSSARKPVSMAEVDLVLDNSDHTLPVDYKEVAITRRMYRTGESEYLINGSPCRLLDITDILHDSGLGKDTHSIIGQGKLDAILASRPEERRQLIEEAAGISKHKRRRERAARKLESMDVNLKRALDIQREVNRRLRPLERQVEAAKRHNAIDARARELRVVLAVDDLRQLQRSWDEVLTRESQVNATLEICDFRLRQRSEELAELEAKLEASGLSAGDLNARRERAQASVERARSQIRLLDEKGRALANRLQEARASKERANDRIRACAQELAEATEARDTNCGELQVLRDRMNEADTAVRDARKARQDAESALSKASGDQRSATRDRDAATIALAKAREGLEGAAAKDRIFSSRIQQVDESIAQLDDEVNALQQRIGELEGQFSVAKEAEGTALSQLTAVRRRQSDVRRELGDAQGELRAVEAQVRASAKYLEDRRDATPLLQRLAKEPGFDSGAFTRAHDILAGGASDVELLERVLGDDLAAFMMDDGQGPLASIGVARKAARDGGDSALFCVEGAPVEHVELEGCVPLAEAAGLDEGLSARLGHLIGRFMVVGDLDIARVIGLSMEHPALTFVLDRGSMRVSDGRVTVGIASSSVGGLMAQIARLDAQRAELPGLRERVEELDRRMHADDQALQAAEAASTQATREKHRLEAELNSARSESMRLGQSKRKLASERERVAADRAVETQRHERLSGEVRRQESILAQATERARVASEAMTTAQPAFDDARRSERIAHDDMNQIKLDLTRSQERTRGLEDRVARLQREHADLTRTLDQDSGASADLAVMVRRVEPLRARLNSSLEVAMGLASQASDASRLVEVDSAQLKAVIQTTRDEVAAAREAYNQASTSVGDIKVEKARLDVGVANALQALSSLPGVVVEDALNLPEPEDRFEMKRELQELEVSLQAIGPVNQVAFQEYEVLKDRSDHINEQVADLQHAVGDVTKIINLIDRKMKSSFLKTFDTVNRNFGEIFGMLFPGGSARIVMTDPEDPMNSGIEVEAQPRGKRVAKMSLLSGGERSLTALGLLFAVYRTRTVPFYVLDEVEAALDDSNLDRLLDAIAILREQTQLIVISHQRRTMESADVLYGVSMQADGVSRVVSQKLDRHGNVAPDA